MRIIQAFGGAILCLGMVFCLGCASELVGERARLDVVETPTGMAVHPNGRYAYVAGANFDLAYRATDGGAMYVVDLETNQVIESASKRMGSFSGNVVLSPDATRGYTVTRDDDALVWFEISPDGSRIFCPNDPESDSLLKCRVIVGDDPTHVAVTRSRRDSTSMNASGNVVHQFVEFDLLMIAQMRNARVTAMTVQKKADQTVEFSHETASFVSSASEVLWIGRENFVVTGRAASNLLVISPAIDALGHVKGLYASQGIVVPTGQGVYQGRGMTIDPNGQTLYLLNQYPNSLLKFDISGLAKNDAASDKAQLIDMLLLPNDMLKIAWIGEQEGYLYLSSVVDNSLYVVDPRQMQIVKVIEGRGGPYELELNDSQLYVLDFLDQTLAQYDVSDPLNPVHVRDFLKENRE